MRNASNNERVCIQYLKVEPIKAERVDTLSTNEWISLLLTVSIQGNSETASYTYGGSRKRKNTSGEN